MQPEELLGNPNEKKNESPLKSLETELILYSDSIKEVAEDIIEELSKYPIFIAHQHEARIGELIIDKEELATEWNIHASTLEEFIEKGIVKAEKEEFFKQNYKDPNLYICVFVMVPEGANFVFYPFK
jgi:GTP-dependent phosphoenolpyruvate carboxykinase